MDAALQGRRKAMASGAMRISRLRRKLDRILTKSLRAMGSSDGVQLLTTVRPRRDVTKCSSTSRELLSLSRGTFTSAIRQPKHLGECGLARMSVNPGDQLLQRPRAPSAAGTSAHGPTPTT